MFLLAPFWEHKSSEVFSERSTTLEKKLALKSHSGLRLKNSVFVT